MSDFDQQILPGTGRGTAGTVVVGARLLAQGCVWGIAPSVSPADCHLPVPGRI